MNGCKAKSKMDKEKPEKKTRKAFFKKDSKQLTCFDVRSSVFKSIISRIVDDTWAANEIMPSTSLI